MYIQLKSGKEFINPNTGQIHTKLTAGVTLVKLETRNKSVGILVEFHETRELMIEGKQCSFNKSFTIEDAEGKTDFTNLYMANPNLGMFGINMEKLMYDFILNELIDFEIIN